MKNKNLNVSYLLERVDKDVEACLGWSSLLHDGHADSSQLAVTVLTQAVVHTVQTLIDKYIVRYIDILIDKWDFFPPCSYLRNT